MSQMERRPMIEATHSELSVVRQCQLLNMNRSTWHYQPVPISAEELAIMKRLDELYAAHPFFGARKLTYLLTQEGYQAKNQHYCAGKQDIPLYIQFYNLERPHQALDYQTPYQVCQSRIGLCREAIQKSEDFRTAFQNDDDESIWGIIPMFPIVQPVLP